MADRYWVGTDDDWFTAANWSASSGGAGGAGVPTSSDDVYFDSNGYILCQPDAGIECNDLNLDAAMTELLILYAGGTVYGDFTQDGGYYASIGEATIDFRGNVTLNAGTFTKGTVGGQDPPHTEFSGTGKTITNNSGGNIGLDWCTISGTITTAGTRLQTMLISGDLKDVSGTLTIGSGTRTWIGNGGTWSALTGTITGAGTFGYQTDASAGFPTTGTIDVDVEIRQDASFTLPARTWGGDFLIDVRADQLTLTMGAGKHYFDGDFEMLVDDAAVTTDWTLDCDANDAEFRCGVDWFVNTASFKQPSQFILKWGDGTHIICGNFQLGPFGGNTNMSMDCGDSDIILWAKLNQQYIHRLSRTKGYPFPIHDTQTWNNIYLLRTASDSSTSFQFIEGFNAEYMRWEIFGPNNVQIRGAHTGMTPTRVISPNRWDVVGQDDTKPTIGQPVNGFGWCMAICALEEANIFGVTFINTHATDGIELATYNCDLGASDQYTTGVTFYDRDIVRIPTNRNIINNPSKKIIPDQVPDIVIERMIEEKW